MVINLPPGTTTVSTLVGLAAPGSEALYKLYNVLDTNNEKGSIVVKITRPE